MRAGLTNSSDGLALKQLKRELLKNQSEKWFVMCGLCPDLNSAD